MSDKITGKRKRDEESVGNEEVGKNRENLLLTPTQVNLLEMAKYSEISATSYMLTLGSQSKPNCFLIEENDFKGQALEEKAFCALYINKLRVVACIDSGSDLTIMQMDLFNRIFANRAKSLLKPSEIKTLTSFSQNTIEIKGQLQCSVSFIKNGPLTTLNITVISNIHGVPTFLFGMDSMRISMAILAFNGDINQSYPELIIRHPIEQHIQVFDVAPRLLQICTAEVDILPFETKPVQFNLHAAAPVIRTDFILIESFEWDTIHILPSRSPLTFNPITHSYQGTAQVANLVSTRVTKTINARFEVINNSYSIPISKNSKYRVKRHMRKFPPVREILPAHSENLIQIPTLTVCNLSVNHETAINPKQLGDIAGINKVSYTGTAEISSEIIDAGLEIPNVIYETPDEALNLTLFDPEIVPYIKNIFLEKYRGVVSLHPMDAGDISRTLGFLSLKLIPGENLPRHKRIFHLSPQDNRYLEELLEQFIRFNYMIRAPIDQQNGHHLYGMSAYLIPRKKPTDLARLIIDFSPLTSIIQSPPAIVPDISAALQHLKGRAMFSTMDMRQGYYALRLDEKSRALTTFLTPKGAYQLLTMPTGAACSPAYFLDAMAKVLKYRPVLDDQGNPIYEDENKVKLEKDIIEDCFCYMDDVSCGSSLKRTYGETLDHHFKSLERIVERLAFHNLKLNVNKCEFAKGSILYLGWVISHDFIIPDPRRMEKIKLAAFPQSKKEMRSFLGLVNSIRRVISINVVREMNTLTPLTSSKKEVTFSPTECHRQAFDKIKGMLVSEPLFCNLIDEHATKYMFVDACTTTSTLGCTLLQRIDNCTDEKVLPTCLNLNNKVHREIYNRQWPYQPCKIFTKLPIELPKPSELKTIPPKYSEEDHWMGFTAENAHDSFFYCIISICAVYGCKIPENTLELRKIAVQQLKKGILGIKLKDSQFNNDHFKYKSFLSEFEQGLHNLDPEFLLAKALASATHRPYIFISTLQEHHENPVFKFNTDCKNPPLIFGIHLVEGKRVFQPYFYNKNMEFSIDSLKGKVQIIAYLAKSVGENFKNRSILDLEVFSILESLHSLRKYISNTKCILLTDSRVLYYLFHQRVGDSSVKIRRWVLKLLSDYPLVTLHFIRTTANLADYLTRQGLPKGDLNKIGLKNMEIENFHDKLPKETFTLEEWNTFCKENPQYLTIVDSDVNLTVDTNMASTTPEKASSQVLQCNINWENTELMEFHDNLLGKSANLAEWNEFCQANPQHLKIEMTGPVIYALTQGISNLQDLINPLEILKNRLERNIIIENQKLEFQKIYENCQQSNDFKATVTEKENSVTYQLQVDLLLIKENRDNRYRILWPESMTGLLLSYLHLIGHMGITKMLANLTEYSIKNKYTKVKTFVSMCYPCFLMHKSSRRNVLGNYPIPTHPFEEISMDLAENLNKVKGYENLLIIQDVLSDFVLIYPMKSKTATELIHIFMHSVFQVFNIKRVHSDNAACFRNRDWLQLMAAFKIKIIDSSAHNPSSRGKAERAVQQVKTIMRKLLVNASSGSLNWEYLPLIVSKVMNQSITPRTGFSPMEMLVGRGDLSKSFLDLPPIFPTHHFVKNKAAEIRAKSDEITKMSKIAAANLKSLRENVHDSVNKNRIDKKINFSQGDIVFTLDRYILPGNSRPLKSKFFPSPYVVIEPKYTTCLIERLADNFRTLISNDDIKKFKNITSFDEDVPESILKIFQMKFSDLLPDDLEKITNFDPLKIPPGINLSIDEEIPIDNENIFFNLPERGEGGEDQMLDPVCEMDTGILDTDKPLDMDTDTVVQDTDTYDPPVPDTAAGTHESTSGESSLPTIYEEEDKESGEDSYHVLRSGRKVSFAE